MYVRRQFLVTYLYLSCKVLRFYHAGLTKEYKFFHNSCFLLFPLDLIIISQCPILFSPRSSLDMNKNLNLRYVYLLFIEWRRFEMKGEKSLTKNYGFYDYTTFLKSLGVIFDGAYSYFET